MCDQVVLWPESMVLTTGQMTFDLLMENAFLCPLYPPDISILLIEKCHWFSN